VEHLRQHQPLRWISWCGGVEEEHKFEKKDEEEKEEDMPAQAMEESRAVFAFAHQGPLRK
jgi:hypothetical protein